MNRRTIPVVSLLAAIAFAGCGSSGSGGSSQPAAAAPSTSSAATNASSGGSPYGPAQTTAAAPAAAKALIEVKPSKLGSVLAYGAKKLTVYMFEADKPGSSSCSGACAQVWPPVLGSPSPGPGASAAALGTITRSDGKTQVTYRGHPLYLYARDGDSGDAYGQGLHSFGAGWYALSARGTKVDNS